MHGIDYGTFVTFPKLTLNFDALRAVRWLCNVCDTLY